MEPEGPIIVRRVRCGVCRTAVSVGEGLCTCPACGATRRWTCVESDEIASWSLQWVPASVPEGTPTG